MSGRCSYLTDDHRRKVGAGVSKAWQKRFGEGFRPKSPSGQAKWIARFLHTNDPVWAVEYLENSHRRMCDKLQELIHKYHLGLGGEFIDELIVAEYERMRAALEESVKLQSHYAMLLNGYDGGRRMQFPTADCWLERLDTLRKKAAR